MRATAVIGQQPAVPQVRTPAAAARTRTVDSQTGGLSAVQPLDVGSAGQQRRTAPAPISGPVINPAQVAASAAAEPEPVVAPVPATAKSKKEKATIEETGSKVMKVIMVILILAVIGFALYLLFTQPGGVTNTVGPFAADGGVEVPAVSVLGQVGSA